MICGCGLAARFRSAESISQKEDEDKFVTRRYDCGGWRSKRKSNKYLVKKRKEPMSDRRLPRQSRFIVAKTGRRLALSRYMSPSWLKLLGALSLYVMTMIAFITLRKELSGYAFAHPARGATVVATSGPGRESNCLLRSRRRARPSSFSMRTPAAKTYS